jgi:hypothetical protein
MVRVMFTPRFRCLVSNTHLLSNDLMTSRGAHSNNKCSLLGMLSFLSGIYTSVVETVNCIYVCFLRDVAGMKRQYIQLESIRCHRLLRKFLFISDGR